MARRDPYNNLYDTGTDVGSDPYNAWGSQYAQDHKRELEEREEEEERKRLEEEARREIEESKGEDSRSLLSKIVDQLNVADSDRTFKQPKAQDTGETGKEQLEDFRNAIVPGISKVEQSLGALTGATERASVRRDRELREGTIDREEYQRQLDRELEKTSWAGTEDEGILDRLKKSAGATGEFLSEVVPVGRGVKAGAAMGALGSVGGELSDEDEFDWKNVAGGTLLGGVLGRFGRKSPDTPIKDADGFVRSKADDELFGGVEGGIDDLGRSLDAEDAFRNTQPQSDKLLPDPRRKELFEIDEELDGLRRGDTDPNAYSTNPEDIRSLEGEKVGRLNKMGAYGETRGATVADSSDTASRARELMRRRQELIDEIDDETLLSIPDDVSPSEAAIADPEVGRAARKDLEKIDSMFDNADPDYTPGLLTNFSTSERVFKRAGLDKEFQVVRDGWDATQRATRIARQRVQSIADSLPSKESNAKVFKFLDGQDVRLTPEEMRIAEEARTMLGEYAERLGLPPESRITEYVPHLFDVGDGRIDPELLRLVRKNPGADVTSKNLLKRLGKEGYKEDLIEALDVYSSRAERQINMQEGLNVLQASKNKVSQGMTEFINDQINAIKQTPGVQRDIMRQVDASLSKIGLKPGSATKASQGARNIIYRATLGLNFGSPIRNLSQFSNTYAKLGRYAGPGYAKAAKQMVKQMKDPNALSELHEMGVLDDTLEKALRGVGHAGTRGKLAKAGNKADQLLWFMFDTSEKLNRASAYYGAKTKALAKGASEKQAKKAGAELARKTQFKFSPIDTPKALRGEITKNLTQFQSFNIKQVEFIKDMVVGEEGMFKKMPDGKYKLSAEGAASMARFIGANFVFMHTVGDLIGMEEEDFIPFWSNISEGKLPESPMVQLVKSGARVIEGKNEYGGEESRGELAKDLAGEAFGLLVPGGTQIKKTAEGLGAVERGFSETNTSAIDMISGAEDGRIRFPVENSPENMARAGLFGQYNTPEGQEYFERGGEPLSDRRSNMVRDADPAKQEAYYEFFSIASNLPSRDKVSKEVTKIYKDGGEEKAKRRAAQWNAEVESAYDEFFERYGAVDETLQEEFDSLKIPIESISRRRKYE